MATINLQCNGPSQIHSSVYFSMTSRAYIGEVHADTSLAKIHEEMSELLDKQVNV